jgi:hypothetical protein
MKRFSMQLEVLEVVYFLDKGKKASACHVNAINICVFNVKDWKH